MRRLIYCCLLASALALSASLAAAQNIIDQNQPEKVTKMAGLYQTGLAQSFQTNAATITGAGVQIWQTEESGPITIALWDALPTQGGVKLAEGEARGLGVLWVDTFWAPVKAEAGKTYYLTFTSDIPYFIIGGSLNDCKHGMAYANDYTPFAQFDYTFRTYAGPPPAVTAPVPAPVPEPDSVAMLLVGLCAIYVFTRGSMQYGRSRYSK
ncbi:PEP-CTERM sorting domain-containing protein [Duganella radicis]|uniref:PEP-CTERM sorting domain-containing protein n=1 Tax=Duganella radicis TaxID=551988 RepID=A0A6L6PHK5_9BURK|nr:PEP-CTERM sorting domain-containing protein [Duganella radicis]MTV38057.1 PEP-CTERM sorting domain-containing protein [Duganella radicis]